MSQGRVLLILAAFLAVAVVSQSQDWKQIGPAPIQDSVGLPDTPNATVSGLVNDIAIDPTGLTDSTIYIATAGGGIWKTMDGGAKWSPLTDLIPAAQTMGAVALDPVNPLIVYAGAGGWYCCAGGGGIYRSSNGGKDWTVLNPGGIFTGVSIDRIVLPSSQVLLVSTNNGLYKSIDGGEHFGNNPPVVGHVFNSFDNSQPIPITTPNGIVSNGNISDLKLDTATTTTVYAAVDGMGVFKSIDFGSTFPASGEMLTSADLLPGVTSFSEVKFAQSTQPNNQTFYVTIAVTDGQPLGPPYCSTLPHSYVPALAMFKSTNGGATWPTRIKVGADVTTSLQCCGYDQTIGVDPQDAKRVYIGLRGLFESSDGGESGFYDSSNGCHAASNPNNRIDINKAHADQHAITFSRHFTGPPPTRVFTGNDGGIASTAAQGSTPGSEFQLLNNGLATVLFYGMDIGRGSRAHDSYIYGAAQDNGISAKTPSQSGTNDWEFTCCGDGNGVTVDHTNPLHAIGINDGCFSSTTSALNWSSPGATACNNVFPAQTQALASVYFDPNGGTAYAYSGPQLFQSKGNGNTFLLMHTFPQNVTAMNQVKIEPNTIWVGLYDGTVQVTQNAQQGAQSTWTARTIPGAPVGQAVTGIAIDPVSTNTVVVVYPGANGYDCPAFNRNCKRTKHVFLTSDGGPTWHNRSGTDRGSVYNDLPDLSLHAVVIVPYTSPHTIVVGSDAGVMQSADLGETWQVLGTGLPTVEVTALAFDPEVNPPVLRAATFGRSVFELPFYPDPPQCQSTPQCDGSLQITCTGPDVGIEFPNCSNPNGGLGCSIGFNGSSEVSEHIYRADPEGKACTKNESAKNCVTLDFPFGGEPPGPPGLACQSCPGGQKWCDKLNPPRCIAVQDCLVTPTHPDQQPPRR